jgi:hypothetical protein
MAFYGGIKYHWSENMIIVIPVIIIVGILAWILRPTRQSTASNKVAILLTIIPPVLTGLASIIVALIYNRQGSLSVPDITNILFVIGLCWVGLAFLAIIGFAFARKWEVVKGTGFGFCVSVILIFVEFGLLEWIAGG